MDCSPPGSSVHGFPRQEHWSGLPFPPPGHLPRPGVELVSPALGSLPLSRLGSGMGCCDRMSWMQWVGWPGAYKHQKLISNSSGGSDRGSSEALMRTLFRVADAYFSVFSIHSDGAEKELSGDFFFSFLISSHSWGLYSHDLTTYQMPYLLITLHWGLGFWYEFVGIPGEGNGNPLQYSRLENPIDGGAW